MTLFTSAGVSQEYIAVSVVFSNLTTINPKINVTLGSEQNSSLVVQVTREPYFLAICPGDFLQGSYYLSITTDSTAALSFDINAIQESAEISVDALVPFVATTQRYFVFAVRGGSEPNLRVRVERLLEQGNVSVRSEDSLAPKEVYVGINRCPEPRCPGKGDNSRNTNCGYDAKDEPSERGEGVIRSLATPDGLYYVLLEPRSYAPAYLSIIVSNLGRVVAPSLALLALGAALLF